MIACLDLKNNKRTKCHWKWVAFMLKADTNGILWCFTDISMSRGEAPVQPQLNFPKTLQGDRNRSFNGEWYAVHPWLGYSISEDSTFCYSMPAGISVYLAMLSLHVLQVQVSKTGKKLPIQTEGMLHIVDLSITRMPC